MGLLSRKCVVEPREQGWIEESMAWLATEFGPEVLRRDPVLPTAGFFPGPYAGTDDDIRRVVARVCAHFDVDPGRLTVEVEPDDGEAEMRANLRLEHRSTSAAGHFRRVDGRPVIAISARQATRPVALVATIAHELGHVRLLDEGRISTSRADHEPLTDLLTVYFGLGVFSANAAFDFRQGRGGWSYQRLGYLTEQMFGYALACYAHRRGESAPGWARHLDTNPRGYMKQSLRFLEQHPPAL